MKKNGRHAVMQFLLGTLTLATLAVGSALPAFADDTATTPSFNKVYQAYIPENESITDFASPEETFKFTGGVLTQNAEPDKATNTATLAALQHTRWNSNDNDIEELDADSLKDKLSSIQNPKNIPQTVELGTASYKAGQATTSEGATIPVSISKPSGYTSAGVYYYDFHEFQGKTAGVNYDANNYRVAVTVENDKNNVLSVSGIKIINKSTGYKNVSLNNSYNAGKLTFTKKVSGNLGDVEKEFDVYVTLTAPASPQKIVNSTIFVTGEKANEQEIQPITPEDWTSNSEGEVTVQKRYTVKNGTSITLKNIPAGVSYLVKEKDYSDAGYETKYERNGSESPIANENVAQKMLGEDNISITITNTRTKIIDTGIFTSNLPYFIILVVAVGGAVIFGISRRKRKA